MALQTASTLTLLLTFLVYFVPLYGGFVADSQLGRVNANRVGIFAGFVDHILFMITSAPTIIKQGHSIVPTILGIIALAKVIFY